MKHGFYGTKFYKIFFRIKEYCKNPNSKKYKNFGKKESNVHGKILYLSKMICMKVI